MRKLLPPLALILGFHVYVVAQTAKPTPTADEETVRITTSLIQIDVVVTDKSGNPVIDLRPEDFSIYQDGKLQRIVDLSFVDYQTSSTGKIVTEKRSRKKLVQAPPVTARAEGSRIITFVVDDGNCLATIDGTVNVRESLETWVREKMLPNDKVAIYQTRNGSSLMQMYTSNKEVLLRKIQKINLIPSGACGSAFDALRDNSTLKATGSGQPSFENDVSKQSRKDNEKYEQEKQVIGTIGVISFVVDRLKALPQRKTVFLLSEGIIANVDNRAHDVLRELADKASRSSVVINTISAKGLTIPGFLSAQDEVLPGITGGVDQTTQAGADRVEEERQLNAGLAYLAYATGGEFVRNKSFMEGDIQRIIDSEHGYYLVAYEPEEGTFDGKEFHRIEIKINKPGLDVRSRKGFFGRTDKESQPVYKSADSPLFQAIGSPVQETGIDMRLTTLFPGDGRTSLRTLFYIPGKDLTFSDGPDGEKKADIDVVAVALDEKGKVAEEFNRRYIIRIPKQAVSAARENGLDFSADIPFKRPGIYSLRLAVRDNLSKRLGSAGDFIEIFNLEKGRFLISGLIATTLDAQGKPTLPHARKLESSFGAVTSTAVPAVRKFVRGMTLAYVYTIHNAKPSKAGTLPILTRQIRLYKDGNLVVEGQEKPIEIVGQSDPSPLQDTGVIGLSDAVVPGEYILQVIVRDKVTDKVSSQWVDFEVVQ